MPVKGGKFLRLRKKRNCLGTPRKSTHPLGERGTSRGDSNGPGSGTAAPTVVKFVIRTPVSAGWGKTTKIRLSPWGEEKYQTPSPFQDGGSEMGGVSLRTPNLKKIKGELNPRKYNLNGR